MGQGRRSNRGPSARERLPRLVRGEEPGACPGTASSGRCERQGELPRDVGRGWGFGHDLCGAAGCSAACAGGTGVGEASTELVGAGSVRFTRDEAQCEVLN